MPVDLSTYTYGGKTGLKNTGGKLKMSGTVEPHPEEMNVEIGYNTEYALIQHEDMTFRHTRPGAKAKYLEDPAMQIAPQIAPGIVERMQYYFTAGVPDMTRLSAGKRELLGSQLGRFA